jgi:hypothetical protein
VSGETGGLSVENYFNYFTEIEEHFQNRRGTLTLLSPLDWSLIESFQSAGIPIDIVLRGIDRAFEKYSKKRSRTQKVNSLAYCTQAILAEFERHKENMVGGISQAGKTTAVPQSTEDDKAKLLQLFDKASLRLTESLEQLPFREGASIKQALEYTTRALQEIKAEVGSSEHPDYEHLEMRLSILEEKLLASLVSNLSEEVLLTVRAEVQREIQRHRRNLKAEQMALLERKMMHKHLFDQFHLPRLSLFYLPLN